jgi:hypothetical protein
VRRVTLPNGSVQYDQQSLIDSIARMAWGRDTNRNRRTVTEPFPRGDASTFAAHDLVTQPDLREMLDEYPYLSILGKLNYLMRMTRPDIAYAVSVLSSYAHTFGPKMVEAMEHLVAFVVATRHESLTYRAGGSLSEQIVVLSDASYASDLITRRSRTGLVILVYGCPIQWQSIKQKTVSLSSMEAETVALTEVAKKTVWLRRVLAFLGHPPSGPTVCLVDNKSTIAFADTGRVSELTKHMQIRNFWLKEAVDAGHIQPVHLPGTHEIADVLTKTPDRHYLRLRRILMGFDAKTDLKQVILRHKRQENTKRARMRVDF